MDEVKKILVCSADQKFVGRLKDCLPPNLYVLVEILHPLELVQKVYDEMPYLVLADLHLSDVGAFDLCNQMKTDIILGHIPLIVFTDSPKLGKRINCGANLYLHKPVQEEELLYHIDRIITESMHELDVNPLTHLPGNRSSVQKMESVLASRKPFSICYIDLKNLYVYNQSYGVHRGDFLIRETAGIIKHSVTEFIQNESAFIGHLGGDDFVVLTDPETGPKVAERITEAFDSSVHKFYERVDRERGYLLVTNEEGKFEQHSFASLSIAIITNELIEYKHVAELAKTASQIHRYLKRFPMSAFLKDRRRDTREAIFGIGVSKTNPSLRAEPVVKARGIRANHDILAAIDQILKTRSVDVFLQPIIHMKNQNVFGYEALSWFPRENGNYWDPGSVFGVAREVSMTKELDVLCAKNALQNAREMPAKEKLFINLNRETLIDPECVAEIFKNCPLKTSQIVIELTEQSVLKELDRVREAIKGLRDRGIQVAIDDMGGGSVSLREVAILQPDFIKFDGSLIRDVDKNEMKQKILNSLLVFARSLKTQTTAEGIETKSELQYLQQCGIDFGQGFFIAKPWKMSFTKQGQGRLGTKQAKK